MATRVAELEAQIRRLVHQRDAQPPDTLYALTHQRRIDEASIELIAWQLEPAKMLAAEAAIRTAARQLRRAHNGRSLWPAAAGATGVLGAVATAGHLAADASGPPAIGGVLLATAAAALALTVVDRRRDAREAAQAEADMDEAQRRYAALVARHRPAIAPLRPLAIHQHSQEDLSCSPQPSLTSITTTRSSGPAAAVTAGRPGTASRPLVPSWPTAVA